MTKSKFQINSNFLNYKYLFIWNLVIICYLIFGIWNFAFAATNINDIYHWAWNDVIGWLDFYSTDTVIVKANKIEGYVDSQVGYISLDCATGPVGSDCSIPYNVSNDGSGNLSGWAWNDVIGWISFSCNNDSSCSSSPYGVTINTSNGEFWGWAWNDVIGWISFNCGNVPDSCSISPYKVKTSAGTSSFLANLTSSIFDLGVDHGTLNALLWKGIYPSNTVVKFQIASSDSISGPWIFVGPDGTPNSYYQPSFPDIFKRIKGHHNIRYFRYKIFLDTDTWQETSPTVNEVIFNYGN